LLKVCSQNTQVPLDVFLGILPSFLLDPNYNLHPMQPSNLQPFDKLRASSVTCNLNVVALAGGVGGAKMAHGLAQCLLPENFTVIVNVGDDFEHLGLKICPDLDTVCYTLAGLANPITGWGRADETWNAFSALEVLGGPNWFRLGDRDLATHLERTRLLREGHPLSQITQDFCKAWGIPLTVLPITDDPVPTWVYTENGELPFQEYFVKEKCQPQVTGFRFAGAEDATPAPGVLDALDAADVIVICPSNPWVSVDPILAIGGVRQAVQSRPVFAVSPIIGGQTVKGPAAKMYRELGIEPSASAVARHYAGLLTGFILDHADAAQSGDIQASGVRTLVTDTLMPDATSRRRLAAETLAFAATL
jgi:LPPG:FO 2-phospho-L-lactate transferase